jgi:MinD-like ATPase involved in chromosome partitioning or flagellar assembly
MIDTVVIGVVDRSGTVRRVAVELASRLADAKVVDFGRPVELGASSPRADVLFLGPGEITEAGLRREAAWRKAHPISATIAVVPRGGPATRDLQRRGLEVIRDPFTIAKAERAFEKALEGLNALAREAARWDAAEPQPHADADAPAEAEAEAEVDEQAEHREVEPEKIDFVPLESVFGDLDAEEDEEESIHPVASAAMAGSQAGQARNVSGREPPFEGRSATWPHEPREMPDDVEELEATAPKRAWDGLFPNGMHASTVEALQAAPRPFEMEAFEPAASVHTPTAANGRVEENKEVAQELAQIGHGRVITIASATGGCGKTFYATNLAAALAEAGHRVVLVDLDLQFGEVSVALRMQHPYSIYDGLYDSKGRPLPEEAFASQLPELVAHHALGFDVIVAPKSPEFADYVGAADAARVLRALTPCYDIIIVDTPPSLNEVVLTALDASDLVAIMATPDVPSLKNLRVFLDTLKRLRIPDRGVRLILNKVDKDIGLDVPEVQDAFQQKFVGLIPQSNIVSRAINAGTVAIQLAPQSPVSRRLRESMEAVLPPGTLKALPGGTAAEHRKGWLQSINRFLRHGFGSRQEVTHEAL